MKNLLFIMIALASFSSHANFYNGNDLRKWSMALEKSNLGNRLTSSEASDASMFQGFVAGVFDYGEGVYFCPKGPVRLLQLTDAVTNYVKMNPGMRSDPASNIVEQSLMDTFPCKKQS